MKSRMSGRLRFGMENRMKFLNKLGLVLFLLGISCNILWHMNHSNVTGGAITVLLLISVGGGLFLYE